MELLMISNTKVDKYWDRLLWYTMWYTNQSYISYNKDLKDNFHYKVSKNKDIQNKYIKYYISTEKKYYTILYNGTNAFTSIANYNKYHSNCQNISQYKYERNKKSIMEIHDECVIDSFDKIIDPRCRMR